MKGGLEVTKSFATSVVGIFDLCLCISNCFFDEEAHRNADSVGTLVLHDATVNGKSQGSVSVAKSTQQELNFVYLTIGHSLFQASLLPSLLLF